MNEPRTHRRIALLICDVPVDTVREKHGDYTRIFGTLLEESLKPLNHTRSAGSLCISKGPWDEAQPHITDPDSQTSFTLEPFDVRAPVYPKDVEEYDAMIITEAGVLTSLRRVYSGV